MLTVVIPAKNESLYLPKLLDSLKSQKTKAFGGLEIMVADAHSSDDTRDIALRYGAKVINGGLPAYGRNMGAYSAKGDIVVAIDADVVLPDNPYFLAQSLMEFKEKSLDIAGTLQSPIPTGKSFKDWLYKVFYGSANKALLKAQHTPKPYMQVCMFAKRDVYGLVGGFRNDLNFGEDSQFARDAVHKGFKFGILESAGKVLISPRRFEKGGLFFMLKNLYYVIGMKLGHEFVRDDKRTNYWDSEGGAR